MPKVIICAALVGGMMLAAISAGCDGARLTQEERIELLLHERARLQQEINQRDLRIAELSGEPSTSTKPEVPPAEPEPEDPFRAVAIRFSHHTAGVNIDDRPGDDQIKVILEPLDTEGDVVKRAGSLQLEILAERGDRTKRIGLWEFNVTEMSRNWLTGPLGLYGYVLRLPWPKDEPAVPTKLLLQAKFRTLDGRLLAAEATITINPAGKE